MTSFTLDYVRSLTAPKVVINEHFANCIAKFANEQLSRASLVSRLVGRFHSGPVIGGHSGDEAIISRNDLTKFVGESFPSADVDLVELYALGCMTDKTGIMQSWRRTEDLKRINEAVSERVHDLIEKRPELLHPRLHVKLEFTEGPASIFKYLLKSRVALNPDRLGVLASNIGPGQEMLKRAMVDARQNGNTLFQDALHSNHGKASTATALLRACRLLDLTYDCRANIQGILSISKAGAVFGEVEYKNAVELLKEIHLIQNENGGDGHRYSDQSICPNPQLMDSIDFSSASAHDKHPIIDFIIGMNSRSAYFADEIDNGDGISLGFQQIDDAGGTLGFPGRQITEMVDLVNDIMEPGFRLPLDRFSGLDVIKMVVIAAKDANLNNVIDFWKSAPEIIDRPHSPVDILNWALERPDASGRLVSLDDLDTLNNRLEPVLTFGHLAEVRARVVSREMAAVISMAAGDVAETASVVAQCSSRRRGVRV